MSPRSVGLIMKSIKTDYKLVSNASQPGIPVFLSFVMVLMRMHTHTCIERGGGGME